MTGMTGDPFDDLDGMEPPTDKWTFEEYDPDRDDPPEDHHAQGDDPPDPEAAWADTNPGPID